MSVPQFLFSSLISALTFLVFNSSILLSSISSNHENSINNIDSTLYHKSLLGFEKLKRKGKIKKDIITIIDFRLPSKQKRLWVVDINNSTILKHTLVAHGKNSGNQYATIFSNKLNSYKSSLGFYITGKTYTGKHGLSLLLMGQEKGINDNCCP